MLKLRGTSAPEGESNTPGLLEPVMPSEVDPPMADGEPGGEPHQARGLALDPVSSQSKRIVFIDERAFSRECISQCLQSLCTDIVVSAFANIAQCRAQGLTASHHWLVLFNIHDRRAAEDAVARDMAALKQAFAGAPLVVLSDTDQIECIQEAFERGARGYIPTTSTTLEIAVEVLRLVRAGGVFMPAIGLGSSPTKRESGTSPTPGEHHFTPRQLAVLHHLRQGKANKIIAHELAMSESTVKVHVRNIMKKMKATNRTQVAFRLHRLAGGLDGTWCEDR
jgi:DNA-binding NarL/FixJ family response regulator